MDRIGALLAFLSSLGLAFQLLRRSLGTRSFWELLAASLPLGSALLLLGMGLAGRALHSFDRGLWVGGLACLVLALVLSQRGGREGLEFGLQPKWSDLLWIVFAVLSTLGVAVFSWQYAMHDERMVQGHPALVESLLRGTYPLYFLPFPEIPNKYHIGFDIIAAVFSRILSLPGYRGVDVASVYLWISLVLGLTGLLRRLGVPRGFLGLALMGVLFTGGLGWMVGGADADPAQVPAWQYATLAGRWVHYHFFFYFFQHPMALGAVIFAGTLDALRRWFDGGGEGALAIAALSLGALSLAHVMFFLTLLAALGTLFCLRLAWQPRDWKNTVRSGLLLFLVAAVLAFALGGFFQMPSAHYAGETARLAWPPGYLRYEYFGAGRPMSAGQAVLWYLHSFGLFLLVLPWGLYLGFRGRRPIFCLLGIYCLLSFFIPQLVYYSLSSNIQKWFLGFEFSGKILCAAVLLPLCLGPWVRSLAATVVILSASLSPLRFVIGLTLQNPDRMGEGGRRLAGVHHTPPQGAFQAVVDLLRNRPGDLGMVWATAGVSRNLAIYAGYPVLEIDNLVAMPVAREVLDRRRNLNAQLSSAPNFDLLRGLGIRWVVFSCGELQRLSPAVRDFLEVLKGAPGVEDFSVRETPRDCYLVLKIPKA